MHIPVRRRDAWMRLPINARLLEQERRLLAGVLDGLFGYHLLTVGGWGRHLHDAAVSRIRHHHLVDLPGGQGGLHAVPAELPIETESVDSVVLPHTLELADAPHGVLREAHRVLVGEGTVIVLGFSPWSPWRWRVPWHDRLVSEFRLRDWLALLGFDIEHACRFGWSIPFGAPGVDQWFERRREDGWPLPGGAYLVVGKKRVPGLTTIRPKWKVQKAQATGTVGAT